MRSAALNNVIGVALYALSLLPSPCAAQRTYNLTLPWGVWQSTYDARAKVYHFDDVRFGKAPTGDLRFQASVPPTDRNSEIQKGSDASCWQVVPKSTCSAGGNDNIAAPNGTVTQDEDCLFLDIYIPKKVMEGAAAGSVRKASVVVWLFGGAFLFGSKDYLMNDGFRTPFYDGTGIVQRGGDGVIFVAGNYRVGTFGWLAGTTIEKDGYPNAGLSDQRLLFDWVFNYISQVGGDPNQISAWGESAGASSIVHHLISRDSSTGELLKPRFTRAGMQSPAFQWNWDRQGFQEQTFINFTCLVCRESQSLDCCPVGKLQPTPLYTVKELQAMDSSVLVRANQALFQTTAKCNGLFPVGPSVDGSVIRNLAPLEFAAGTFNKLESVILSHVGNEAHSFVNPPTADTDAEYQGVLQSIFPDKSLAPVRSSIAQQYNVAQFNNNQTLRLKRTIEDVAFLSNNRVMFDAFSQAGTVAYMLVWDLLNGTKWNAKARDYSFHATDLLALFYDDEWDFVGFIKHHNKHIPIWLIKILKPLLAFDVVRPYQTYWTWHARTGDVNGGSYKGEALKNWSPASADAGGVKSVMRISSGLPIYGASYDWQLPHDMAQFWTRMAGLVVSLNGTSDFSSSPSDGIGQEVLYRDDL